jgi:hypothetical protein
LVARSARKEGLLGNAVMLMLATRRYSATVEKTLAMLRKLDNQVTSCQR